MNKKLIGRFPVFVTALSLMKCLIQQREDHWTPILQSMVEDRVVVTLDWDLELTPIQVTFYDHGLLLASKSEESVTYKAECDGSYNKPSGGGGEATGTASIASIIWNGREMVDSQITCGLPSEDSEHAESMALLGVLQRGRQLKISILDVVTDHLGNYETMIGRKNVFEHKHYDIMMAAIQVAKEYEVCRFRYEPRELVCLVNEMAKSSKEDDSIEALNLDRILEKKASCLWGLPIIRINQSENTITRKLDKKVVEDVDMKAVQSKCYYVNVQDHDHKLDALVGMVSVLNPKFLVVLVRSVECARQILPELDWSYDCMVMGGYNPLDDVASTIVKPCTAVVMINETKIPKFCAEKALLVLYDNPSNAVQYAPSQNTSGVITVSIITPDEKASLPNNAKEVDPFLYGFFFSPGQIEASRKEKKNPWGNVVKMGRLKEQILDIMHVPLI